MDAYCTLFLAVYSCSNFVVFEIIYIESKMKYLLEICVDSFESAKNAVLGGAHRLEVCSALELGGLTPTIGLVRCLRSSFPTVPLFVMLRSHGGDFIYSDEEIMVMAEDLTIFKEAGANGFVFGFLDCNNSLDVAKCQQLLLLASNLPCTLHRAFDHVMDWKTTVDQAVEMGFKTILTSGQAVTAMEGRERLKKILAYADKRINILVGSGVTSSTLPILLRDTHCLWFHGSASVVLPSKACYSRFLIRSASSWEYKVTSEKETKAMKNILENSSY